MKLFLMISLNFRFLMLSFLLEVKLIEIECHLCFENFPNQEQNL